MEKKKFQNRTTEIRTSMQRMAPHIFWQLTELWTERINWNSPHDCMSMIVMRIVMIFITCLVRMVLIDELENWHWKISSRGPIENRPWTRRTPKCSSRQSTVFGSCVLEWLCLSPVWQGPVPPFVSSRPSSTELGLGHLVAEGSATQGSQTCLCLANTWPPGWTHSIVLKRQRQPTIA